MNVNSMVRARVVYLARAGRLETSVSMTRLSDWVWGGKNDREIDKLVLWHESVQRDKGATVLHLHTACGSLKVYIRVPAA